MYPLNRELFLVYIPPSPRMKHDSAHILFACVGSLAERGNMQTFHAPCAKALDAHVFKTFGVNLPGKTPVTTEASLDTPNVWMAVGKIRMIYMMRYRHGGMAIPDNPKIGY